MEVRSNVIYFSKRGRSLKYWLLPKLVFFITCYAALQSFFEIKDIEISNHVPLHEKPPVLASIILFRIIGNSLPPLHSNDQSIANLKFMIEHEKQLDSVKKVWIFNRIINPYILQELTDTIDRTGDTYFVFIFNPDKFLKVDYNHLYISRDIVDVVSGQSVVESVQSPVKSNISYFFLNKNLHLMNNNGARNFALSTGIRLGYAWILPWDGNCYVNDYTWPSIFGSLRYLGQKHKYFLSYMIRVTENNLVDTKVDSFEATEEPQIIFRRDALERFDNMIPYGRRSKVALLIRLKIEGDWNNWRWYEWERNINPHYSYSNDSTNPTPRAGFIIRLSSGSRQILTSSSSRFNLRLIAIVRFINKLEKEQYEKRIRMVEELQKKYHGNGNDHYSMKYVFYSDKNRGGNESHTGALLSCLPGRLQKLFREFMNGTKTKDLVVSELQGYFEKTYYTDIFGSNSDKLSRGNINLKCMQVVTLPVLLEAVSVVTLSSPLRPRFRTLTKILNLMKENCKEKGLTLLSKASSMLALFSIYKFYPSMNQAGYYLLLNKLYASLLSASTHGEMSLVQKSEEQSEVFVKYVVSLAFISRRYDLQLGQLQKLLNLSKALCDFHKMSGHHRFNCWLKEPTFSAIFL